MMFVQSFSGVKSSTKAQALLVAGRVVDGSGRVAGRVEPQKKPVNIGYGRLDGLKPLEGWV